MHGLLGSIRLLKLGDMEWLTMSMENSGMALFIFLKNSNQPQNQTVPVHALSFTLVSIL